MSPQAQIVHQLRGRLRLKILDKRRDPDYFAALQTRLEKLPGVSEVRVNLFTGSVVLLHPEQPSSELRTQLEQLGLFEIIDTPQAGESALKPLLAGTGRLDQALWEGSTGSIDLRTLAVTGLLGLAAYQIYRGNFLGPAVPLLLSAYDLAQQITSTTPDTPSGGH